MAQWDLTANGLRSLSHVCRMCKMFLSSVVCGDIPFSDAQGLHATELKRVAEVLWYARPCEEHIGPHAHGLRDVSRGCVDGHDDDRRRLRQLITPQYFAQLKTVKAAKADVRDDDVRTSREGQRECVTPIVGLFNLVRRPSQVSGEYVKRIAVMCEQS